MTKQRAKNNSGMCSSIVSPVGKLGTALLSAEDRTKEKDKDQSEVEECKDGVLQHEEKGFRGGCGQSYGRNRDFTIHH